MTNINWIQWVIKKGRGDEGGHEVWKYGAQGKLMGSDMTKIHPYMQEILKEKHYVKNLTVSRRLGDSWNRKDLSQKYEDLCSDPHNLQKS